jgi:DNA-binding transcriptional MerR regulator
MDKFVDFEKEPMLFPELEEQVQQEELVTLEENYKTISEVAKDLELATSVIRYWETKFKTLSPIKRNGRRYYSLKDQKTIKQIKNLLYIQGYTIKAVQEIIEDGKSAKLSSYGEPKEQKSDKSIICKTIEKLEQIRNSL